MLLSTLHYWGYQHQWEKRESSRNRGKHLGGVACVDKLDNMRGFLWLTVGLCGLHLFGCISRTCIFTFSYFFCCSRVSNIIRDSVHYLPV